MSNSRKHNRRKTSDYFIAENATTGEVVGRILDMSSDGIRLMTMEPVEASRRFKGVIKLQKPIDGCHEIRFEAECRWCLENERAGWYEAGFKFCDITLETVSVIRQLLKDWVVSESQRQNPSDSSDEKERRKTPLLRIESAFRDSSPVTDSSKGRGSNR